MTTETLIDRPEYIRQLKAWQGQNDLIKIVTGVRRCGKSKLFELFQTRLQFDKIADDSQIVSINLEDIIQTRNIGLTEDTEHFLVGYEKLLDYILGRLNPKKMNFVFIDEVQLLRDWQKVANALRLQKNVDVYLTGSNAYMFSSDLANSLGGRYVEIKMQPLSFLEYYMEYQFMAGDTLRTRKDYLKFGNFQATYEHYIRESGFPQTLKMLYDRQHISDYLRDTVYLNTVQKDIVKRFNIADTIRQYHIDMIIYHYHFNPTLLFDFLVVKALKIPFILVQHANKMYTLTKEERFVFARCDKLFFLLKPFLTFNQSPKMIF